MFHKLLFIYNCTDLKHTKTQRPSDLLAVDRSVSAAATDSDKKSGKTGLKEP